MEKIEELREIAQRMQLPRIKLYMDDFIEYLPSVMVPDWNEDKALAITIETAQAALLFFKNLSEWIYNEADLEMPDLYIDCCPGGSMDICWYEENALRLLINIKINATFAYYGYFGKDINQPDFEINNGPFETANYKQADLKEFFKIYKGNLKS